MLDRQRLASWIQPQHFEDRALETYQNAFTSHAARLVVIRDFLVPQVAERLSRFLANEAEFKPEYGLYSIEGAVKEEKCVVASDQNVFVRLSKLVSTPLQIQTSPNALAYWQVRITF